MIKLTDLQHQIDSYLNFDEKLDIANIDPYMSNGLMVRGKDDVNKIGFGVSASLALFEKAKEAECDVLVVHHSFNLPSYNRYDSIFQARFGYLIKNEISLFGYHFLLDAHPAVGNNVQIIKTIGATPTTSYLHRGNPWGWAGEFTKEQELKELEKKIKPLLSSRATIYPYGNKIVKKVVAVSGMGSPLPSVMHDLVSESVDLFITGEVHEWNRELFKEAKINFIAGGHYHTECFGIKALLKYITQKLPDVQTQWLDLSNEI